MSSKRIPIVSLIGRPNVGKSTIFNRILRKNFKAMTYNKPGVTRDRHYALAALEDASGENKQEVILIDTGGFYLDQSSRKAQEEEDSFFDVIADQAKIAIDESDLILFVVDVRDGLLPFDDDIYRYIRKRKKNMWLLINKYDDDALAGRENEFYQLGVDERDLLLISAEHARGLVDLSERLYNFAQGDFDESSELQKGVKPRHNVVANIAIIGAPNAGKSTLLNQLVGANRSLVSPIAGTTVDPIEAFIDLDFGKKAGRLNAIDDLFRNSQKEIEDDLLKLRDEEAPTLLKFDEAFSDGADTQIPIGPASPEETHSENEEDENSWRSVKIVDTAGIRKQANVEGFVEEQSVYRSLKAISESDVVICLVDATKGMTHQDRRLCDISLQKGNSLLLVMNKFDLIEDHFKSAKDKSEWRKDLEAQIPWLGFCELITISAKNGNGLSRFRKSVQNTIVQRNQKVSTALLNRTIQSLLEKFPLVMDKSKGTLLKVKYAAHVKSSPPTFLLFCNKSLNIPDNFRKFLVKGIRSEFNIINTPVHLVFRTKSTKKYARFFKELPGDIV